MSTNGSTFSPVRERIRKVSYDYVYGSPDSGPDDLREKRVRKLRDATLDAVGHKFVALDDLEVEELPKVYRAVCSVAGVHCDLDKPTSRIAEMGTDPFGLTDIEIEQCLRSAIIMRALAEFNDECSLLHDECTMQRGVLRARADMMREHAAFIDWHHQTGTPLP